MDLILLERVEKLGQMGDVVSVKPGYARNYLLPRRKALRATKHNLEFFEGRRSQLEADNLQRKSEAESVAKKVDGLTVPVIRAAGESGQLYGSVTARDIAEAIIAAGVTVHARASPPSSAVPCSTLSRSAPTRVGRKVSRVARPSAARLPSMSILAWLSLRSVPALHCAPPVKPAVINILFVRSSTQRSCKCNDEHVILKVNCCELSLRIL